MNTKRCVHCHKLQRASAQICRGCGQPFVQNRPRTSRSDALTNPSLPSASPHRAGHYSGLHPEDQPYISGKIVVHPLLRAVEAEHYRWSQPEPGHIVLPATDMLPAIRIEREKARAARNSSPARSAQPARPRRKPITRPPYMTGKSLLPQFSQRTISSILSLACILFVLISSAIAFVFIGNRTTAAQPSQQISPSLVRVNDLFTLTGNGFGAHSLLTFSYDGNEPLTGDGGRSLEAHSDSLGRFAVLIRVPGNWAVGTHSIRTTDQAEQLSISSPVTVQPEPARMVAPRLHLSKTSSDLGTDIAGTLTNDTVTLTNAGGGEVSWQASSDQSWLSTSPDSGTFSGSENVQVTVNRGGLAAQAYTGHITFSQKGADAASLTLTVTMAVKPAPGLLTLSTATLTYSGSTAQNPESQSITITNNSAQAMSWSSDVTTGNGSPWLAIRPSRGRLESGKSAVLAVSVQSQHLLVGSYQGWISFHGGADAQVQVMLNVVEPGSLVISPPTSSIAVIAGQPSSQYTISLQNGSGAPLAWTATTTTERGHWLSVAPASGSVGQGAQQRVAFTIDARALKPGAYQGTLLITSGGQSEASAISLTVMPAA